MKRPLESYLVDEVVARSNKRRRVNLFDHAERAEMEEYARNAHAFAIFTLFFEAAVREEELFVKAEMEYHNSFLPPIYRTNPLYGFSVFGRAFGDEHPDLKWHRDRLSYWNFQMKNYQPLHVDQLNQYRSVCKQ